MAKERARASAGARAVMRKARQHGVQRQTGQAVDMRQRAAAHDPEPVRADPARPPEHGSPPPTQKPRRRANRWPAPRRRRYPGAPAPAGSCGSGLGRSTSSRVTQDWNGAYASCSSAATWPRGTMSPPQAALMLLAQQAAHAGHPRHMPRQHHRARRRPGRATTHRPRTGRQSPRPSHGPPAPGCRPTAACWPHRSRAACGH